MQNNALKHDLDYILENTLPLWETLRDKRIFITGGTGFIGCWLLESFVWANTLLNLNASAVVLSRHPDQFYQKCPHLFASPSLLFQKGDVRNFTFPQGYFSDIIHAATDVSVTLNQTHPSLMFDTIVQGTKHTLEFAKECGVNRFLFVSSGIIYGKQPYHMHSIPEDYLYPCNETLNSAYANGKRAAEMLCDEYSKKCNINIKIARCFSFVGPYLPLDAHFAIGNFIYDGLNKNTIKVKSDGLAYRSYLYAADMAIWLWTVLLHGKKMRPYNIGSNEVFTIKNLANLVANSFNPTKEVEIEQVSLGKLPERYIPDIRRAQEELNLFPQLSLKKAIELTIQWHRRMI